MRHKEDTLSNPNERQNIKMSKQSVKFSFAGDTYQSFLVFFKALHFIRSSKTMPKQERNIPSFMLYLLLTSKHY